MADIHVLDAYRNATQVARLTADLAKIFDDGTEESSLDRASLRTEAALLHKQISALYYLLLNLQLEIDSLAANISIPHSEKIEILSASQRLSILAEDLIKSIQRLPIQSSS
jgi:hypothetical protein